MDTMLHTSVSLRSSVTLERPATPSDRTASSAGPHIGHLHLPSWRRAPSAEDAGAERWTAADHPEDPREQLLRLHPNHMFRVH